MYKEVQAYYEAGLEIPEDVTLLFSDDNFGTIRRLPTDVERRRSGGIGVSVIHYYPSDYTGASFLLIFLHRSTTIWNLLVPPGVTSG